MLPHALVIVAVLQAQPGPALPPLPRVLIIGDSISGGYTETVRQLLSGRADVQRIPANGRSTKLGIEKIDEWLGDGRWDLIHFNWGLHDLRIMETGSCQVPLADYEKNLETLIRRLKKTGARLVWATTTPVPQAKVDPPRRAADVIAYNRAAAAIVRRHGAEVNDLYSTVLPRLADLQLPSNVHYKPEGYRFLGERVAEAIERALKLR